MPDNAKNIAILHGVIDLGKYDQNIQRIEEMVERARNEGIEVILLPAMINGVPIFDLRKNIKIKKFTETIPGKTSDYLARLANKFRIHILSGPILERRGSKKYRSLFLIDPSTNIKTIISQINTPPGFSQSFSFPVLNIYGFNIGVFIAEDIHLPELSLLMKLARVDLAIFYPYPQISMDRVEAMMRTRSLELNSMTVCIGYVAKRKDEEITFMPTTIIDENGVVIHEVLDKTTKLIKITLSKDKCKYENTLSRSHKRLLKLLTRTISYYLK